MKSFTSQSCLAARYLMGSGWNCRFSLSTNSRKLKLLKIYLSTLGLKLKAHDLSFLVNLDSLIFKVFSSFYNYIQVLKPFRSGIFLYLRAFLKRCRFLMKRLFRLFPQNRLRLPKKTRFYRF